MEKTLVETVNMSFVKAFVKNINASISEDLHFSLTPSQVKSPPSLLAGSGPNLLRHIFQNSERVTVHAWCPSNLILFMSHLAVSATLLMGASELIG